MKLAIRIRPRRGVILSLGATALAVASAGGQTRARLSDAGGCGRCRVGIRLEATLRPPPSEGTLPSRPYPNSISRDSRGRYYIGFPESPGEPVWIFDRTGRFTGKLGRPGEGPGEFRGVRALRVTPGDTLRVYDARLGRVTVYDPGLRVVRSEPVPTLMWDILWMAPGGEVVSADIRSASKIGLPLHQVDGQGRITRSFGAADAAYSPGKTRQLFRWLAPSPTGFWATSYTNAYVLQHFDASGTEVATLERDADWFPRMSEYWFPTATRAPAPELWGANQSGDSLLWVLARVGDPTWWKGLSRPTRMEGQEVYSWNRYDRVFDSVIEAISLADHRVVAHSRFDSVVFGLLDGNLAAMSRETDDGSLYVEIYRLTLDR